MSCPSYPLQLCMRRATTCRQPTTGGSRSVSAPDSYVRITYTGGQCRRCRRPPVRARSRRLQSSWNHCTTIGPTAACPARTASGSRRDHRCRLARPDDSLGSVYFSASARPVALAPAWGQRRHRQRSVPRRPLRGHDAHARRPAVAAPAASAASIAIAPRRRRHRRRRQPADPAAAGTAPRGPHAAAAAVAHLAAASPPRRSALPGGPLPDPPSAPPATNEPAALAAAARTVARRRGRRRPRRRRRCRHRRARRRPRRRHPARRRRRCFLPHRRRRRRPRPRLRLPTGRRAAAGRLVQGSRRAGRRATWATSRRRRSRASRPFAALDGVPSTEHVQIGVAPGSAC